ncbi:hypothetical protein Franean1_0762 [Parafrankia sp. EAN1pec]|nr:hypothetical protein Franean1_0762 [Frankia sp. EAN1pec]
MAADRSRRALLHVPRPPPAVNHPTRPTRPAGRSQPASRDGAPEIGRARRTQIPRAPIPHSGGPMRSGLAPRSRLARAMRAAGLRAGPPAGRRTLSGGSATGLTRHHRALTQAATADILRAPPPSGGGAE